MLSLEMQPAQEPLEAEEVDAIELITILAGRLSHKLLQSEAEQALLQEFTTTRSLEELDALALQRLPQQLSTRCTCVRNKSAGLSVGDSHVVLDSARIGGSHRP